MTMFSENFNTGQITEGLIAKWLMSRGSLVMPAYQIEHQTGKGPQLFGMDDSFVAPDMLTFTHKGIVWIEAKHKTVFTWHRISRQWTTGIDMRHYIDYMHVGKNTKLPVYLLFFHNSSTPVQRDLDNGSPEACPTGLFGGELFWLCANENHRAPRFDQQRTGMVGHGNSGMVYWAADKLRLFATREEVVYLKTKETLTA